MKTLFSMLVFAFLFTATTIPAALPNQNGQAAIIVTNADPDW
ncbi:hypothetical protein [Brevibacillus sp. LEMMJ03]|nr:hypothetical protein [Brevibacillus sp. LEMMJ03]